MSEPAVPKVLAFDVFGTVVDWHSSIAAAVTAAGLPVDAGRFAGAGSASRGMRSSRGRMRSRP